MISANKLFQSKSVDTRDIITCQYDRLGRRSAFEAFQGNLSTSGKRKVGRLAKVKKGEEAKWE